MYACAWVYIYIYIYIHTYIHTYISLLPPFVVLSLFICSHLRASSSKPQAPYDPPPNLFLQLLEIRSILGNMAADGSKYQAPKPNNKDVDIGKFLKLAERVDKTLTEQCLYPEPKQIDPDRVLVSKMNRLGASPNIKHVHFGILKSFLKNSFDRTRPAVGICVEMKSERGLAQVLEHNRRFSKGNKLLPPILESITGGPIYATLACTHLNLAFRCIKHGVQSPIGDLTPLMNQATLRDAAQNGHRWWILPEALEPVKYIEISLWRNQDQNENQATHEIEILQTVKHSAEEFLAKGASKVNLGDLVSASMKRNPAKISPQSWMGLAKYYIGFLENGVPDLVEDLSEYHSENVDPREISVSLKFYACITSEEAFKSCPQVRHFLVVSQYTNEKVMASSSGPAWSQFLEVSQITSFAKKPDQVNQLEKTIRDLKTKYLPILEKSLGSRLARLELTVFINLIIRCLFAKPWPELQPKITMAPGKYSEDKIKSLSIHWAKVLDLQHPTLGFAQEAGLQAEDEEGDEDSCVPVDLENLRSLKRSASGGPDPEGPKFKRGDEVSVIRKMTWSLPQKNNPNYRKDLPEGLKGIVEGWADTEMRQVLLKVDLTISGKTVSHTQAVYTRNLKLTSDYLLSKAGDSAGSSSNRKKEKAEPVDDLQKNLKFLLGESAPGDVKVEQKWKALLSDDDLLTKTMYVRGRIAVGLEALSETLPKFSEKDFIVCHRKIGVAWKSEIHTKRDFEPFEIMLAPHSSQIKDSHLMASAHAVVTLPKHGRGAHPENQTLALDGRSRHQLASKGTTGPDEHKGSLYWIVTRTPNAKEANLDFENLVWEQQIKLSLPAAKKRKLGPVEWQASELPAFPILVNKKAIPKHTKLCVYLADKKNTKDPKKKD